MLVDKRTGSLVLKLAQPELVLKLLPGKSREIEHEGTRLVQVKHTLQAAKVLNNMGIEAPSPIRYYYGFPRPPHIKAPFPHQIDTSEFMTLNRKCFILNEMGTMKTSSALWATDYLMKEGRVGKCLIVAPLSTLDQVWGDEIFNFIMHRTAVVLHGSAERRHQLLAADVDFYIINFEGLEIVAEELKRRKDINLYIVDEAAKYRNSKNVSYEVLESLITPKKWLWLMTGTPTPNAPTDAWALARLVNPDNVPKYFSAFRKQTMWQKNMFKWESKPGASKIAYAAMQPGIRFRKKDCINLPPVTVERRACELTKDQKRAYKEMQNEMVADAANGVQITAVNAADKLGKLRQILCGAVKTPEGAYVPIDHRFRLRVLMEEIENAQAKVLVIIPYKGITRVLALEVSRGIKDFGPYSCEVVNGDVSKTERRRIFSEFKQNQDPQVLLCHPKVMAHGLTLTQADMLIFYGPINSNELSQQVVERINRPGQTLPMTIVRIGATPLEWDIYATVEGRGIDQESVLSLYQRELSRAGS